jgi:hypothetical protein
MESFDLANTSFNLSSRKTEFDLTRESLDTPLTAAFGNGAAAPFDRHGAVLLLSSIRSAKTRSESDCYSQSLRQGRHRKLDSLAERSLFQQFCTDLLYVHGCVIQSSNNKS